MTMPTNNDTSPAIASVSVPIRVSCLRIFDTWRGAERQCQRVATKRRTHSPTICSTSSVAWPRAAVTPGGRIIEALSVTSAMEPALRIGRVGGAPQGGIGAAAHLNDFASLRGDHSSKDKYHGGPIVPSLHVHIPHKASLRYPSVP